LEDQGIDLRIVLKWMFRKWEEGLGLMWLGRGSGGGLL
jgi:hypothetical protein